MRVLNEIVEKYAGAYPDFLGRTGFKTWQELRDEMKKDIEIYATECCKATLEKLSDRSNEFQDISESLFDAKITKPENIVLL